MSKTVIIGNCEQYIEQFLIENMFEIVHLFDNRFADERIKNHADLSVLRINKKIFAVSKEQSGVINHLTLKGYDVRTIETGIKCIYPDDCRLNFIITNNKAFGNKKAVSDDLIEVFDECSIEFKDVKQGYAKCSSIVLDKAVITDDESIHKALINEGIEVLLIEKRDVVLNGFDYGFIGGASFVDDLSRTVYFFGDIRKHRSYQAIEAFISNHGYSIEHIPEKPLTDIGGAVII